MRRFIFLVCFLAGAAQAAPKLVVPIDLSAPAPGAVQIDGVRPGVTVTLLTEQRAQDGTASYVGHAQFTADAHGRIDTAKMPAQSGTYMGTDPVGLFWSGTARPVQPDDPIAGTVRVTAAVAGVTVATSVVRQGPDPASLITSTDTPFPGAVWVRPKTGGHRPVVIVLGGSEGGSSTARALAPLFAARGYATLGLPYYDPGYDPADHVPGLPRSFTDIPVDRLAAVRDWVATRPEADAKHIALWGASKGAEFALIAASRYPWICAVVAVVPSDLVWEGWGKSGVTTASFSFGGKPLAFQPYAGMDTELAKAAKGEAMDLRRVHLAGRARSPDRVADARIPIEKFRGKLLVIGGGKDQIWPSAEMAASIAATRREAGETTELLIFPKANHFLGGPGTQAAGPLVTAGSDAATIARARSIGWKATFNLLEGAR